MPTPIKTIGSTAGSGEVNIVLNGSAASDTTGWTTTGTAAVTRLSGSGPLNPVISTALRFSSGGVGDYIEAVYSVPSTLRNVKLKVEWSQTNSGASGDWKLDVLNTANTRYALTTDASGVSSISNASGKYTTTFTTDTSATVKLRFVRVAGSSTLDVTNVIVGPGIQPQGAVVGEWQSYTPTLSTNPWGTGAALGFAQYRRVGTAMDIRGRATTGTGTGANLLVIPLPSGFTIVGRGTPTTDAFMVGNAMDTVTTTNVRVLAETGASTTNLYFSNDASTNAFTKLNANAFGDGQVISWNATVDIAEWAGSGTVNLAQNDVEYAYNSSTATAANDTSSFAYGPSGALIRAITTGLVRRVRFQTPIQVGDQITLEYSTDQVKWMAADSGFSDNVTFTITPYTLHGGTVYGAGALVIVNSTDVSINFGTYSSPGVTYNAAGSAWPSNVYWRVRKSSAGAAVGFGIVVPGTSSGLVSASGLPGKTDGTAVASGYVGQVLTSTATVQLINVATQVTSISLTAGVWLVTGYQSVQSTPARTDYVIGCISTTSATSGTTGVNAAIAAVSNNGVTAFGQATVPSQVVSISTTTTYYLNGLVGTNSSASGDIGQITAVRIA